VVQWKGIRRSDIKRSFQRDSSNSICKDDNPVLIYLPETNFDEEEFLKMY
jgi:hypothetical protein